MALQDFFRTVWFGRWAVLLSVLPALAGAWIYVSKQDPAYSAQATVAVSDQATVLGLGVRLDTDPTLVSSQEVAAAAAAEVGRPDQASIIAAKTIGEYATDDESKVLISVTSQDATAAVDEVNAVAAAYVDALQDQYNEQVEAMRARLVEQGQAIEGLASAVTPGVGQGQEVPRGLIEAQYAAAIDRYQALSAQIAEAELVAAPASVRRPAQEASLASTPSIIVFMVATLGGLLLGIGFALALGNLDGKVRTAADAQRAAGAPVLAHVREVSTAVREYERGGELPVASRSTGAYTQSVRELRTAVQAVAMESEPGRHLGRDAGAVLVVTAADPVAPRSFLAANLAASFALSGREVILLSGDLRQPRLNSLLPTSSSVADGTALAELSGVEEHKLAGPLLRTRIPHLSMHAPLRTPLDPADYLASDEVRDLIGALRARVDVVVLDAPPMLVAADAAILGSYADGVLLAASVGETRLTAIEESAERLRGTHARLLGVILIGGGEDRRTAYGTNYDSGFWESGQPPATAVPVSAAPKPAGAEMQR
jgi:Mrp family chromosome partitioning ATPase